MQKITKTFETFSYGELSPEAAKKALDKWNETNDDPYMQSMLNDECGQLLKAKRIKCTSNHPVCLYSLSYCQGDGLMFEGSFTWKGWSIKIKHSGHYYHAYSRTIDIEDAEGNAAPEDVEEKFNALYVSICKKLEKMGYEHIEDWTSEAHFEDEANANEWTFLADGTLFNA